MIDPLAIEQLGGANTRSFIDLKQTPHLLHRFDLNEVIDDCHLLYFGSRKN
jgi:hypothetical protein